MNRKKIIGYTLAGFCLLLFLIYHTFPYHLVKENLVSEIQKNLNKENIPIKLTVKSLRPHWLSGIKLSGVEVNDKFELKDSLKLDEIIIDISLLSLIIGNLTVDVDIYQNEGHAFTSISFPIFPLISGNPKFKEVNIEFKKFSLDSIFTQLLTIVKANEKPEMALILPIISKTTLGGSLNGFIDLYNKGPAKINLKLVNGYLNIQNEALNIPLQNFSKANIALNWDGKKIILEKETGLDSQDMKFAADGFIDTPEDPNKSWQINLALNVTMNGAIEKDFGFLIPQLLNCPANSVVAGVMKINLVGQANNLSCQ
ncbi:type II secretion system protein GspN [Silvanigrella aquatica]|uniref:Type II secretion system protein GspN n=1 Tax=Silvanigrella aquatica TaxID=1915309 RepID=A0A1L4CYG6_9BACT|nr:type II secretion system protein GspN [Silvanigrella aquatica]APJ03001.1 type II secretion system protein GspN [Silvanigrella aquatica]